MKIERRSVAAQIATQIEVAISQGKWAGELPGKRTLAQEFGVNVKTCAVAISILESRGVIGPAYTGRSRSILQSKRSHPFHAAAGSGHLQNRRLLLLHPSSSTLSSEDSSLLHTFDKLWQHDGGEVTWSAVDYERHKNPGGILRKLQQRHSAHAMLLYAPSLPWGKAVSSLVPFYQIGGPYDTELPISLGAFSIDDEISKTVNYLRGQGHRRILIPNVFSSERMRKSLLEGLKTDESPIIKWEEFCPTFPENNPDAWMQCWRNAFTKLRPTAVIVLEIKHLLSLYGFCFLNGIRIPSEISVVCMSYDSSLIWSKPRPTMMRYQLNAASAHFKQWLASGLKPIGRKFFALERIDGDSVQSLKR